MIGLRNIAKVNLNVVRIAFRGKVMNFQDNAMRGEIQRHLLEPLLDEAAI